MATAKTLRVSPAGSPSSNDQEQLMDPDDPARIIKLLSDSQKAQIPYYTGWDSKPNSCLKLVADIENEDNYRKRLVIARACTVIEVGKQRRKYLRDVEREGREVLHAQSTPKSKEKDLVTPPKDTSEARGKAGPEKSFEELMHSKPDNYDHYRDFPDLPDDDEEGSSLSLHCVDSSVNDSTLNQSFKSVSLSPSSFAHLNISEIKSDSSRSSSFRNKSKSSLKSALSSTPVRHSTSTRRVHFEDESLENIAPEPSTSRRSGTFSVLEEDEEYDDYDSNSKQASGRGENSKQETPPSLHIQSPVHICIQNSMDELALLERERIEKWREDVEAKVLEVSVHGGSLSGKETVATSASEEQMKLLLHRRDSRRLNLISSAERRQKLRETELEQEDQQIEATKKLEADKQKAELDKVEAQAAARVAAELREKERLQKLREEEDAQLKAKESAAVAEAQRIQDELKAQEEQRVKQQNQEAEQAANAAAISSPNESNQGVPVQFRRAVLQADLMAYLRLQQKLEEIKDIIKDISTSNPRTKDFYFSAMKVVNTPINSISNLSDAHLQQKVYHFMELLQGKPVYIGDSMKTPFITSSEPNGDLFVQNLLAFRFVKKSEAEITRGMSGLTPLASLGVQLIRRFPSLGTLIRANFYKMCPFLVPLIYPRNENMSNEQYAAALGHEQLGGTERTIQQVLLERLGGYCTLYGIMVNIVEKGQFSDLSPENVSFFSLRELWRILAATMKLEPQVDVTCAVLLALLETSCDTLYRTFRSQFRKLMNELSSNYLRKIRNITPPAQAASLTRLELFLEAQVPKLR